MTSPCVFSLNPAAINTFVNNGVGVYGKSYTDTTIVYLVNCTAGTFQEINLQTGLIYNGTLSMFGTNAFYFFIGINGPTGSATLNATGPFKYPASGYSAWGGTFDPANTAGVVTLSNGNNTVNGTSGTTSSWGNARSTQSYTKPGGGLYQIEVTVQNLTTFTAMTGFGQSSTSLTNYLGNAGGNSFGWQDTANYYGTVSSGAGYYRGPINNGNVGWSSVMASTSHSSG